MANTIEFLMDTLRKQGDRPVLAFHANTMTGDALVELTEKWTAVLKARGVGLGTAVVLKGDYSFNSVALLLALISCNAIIVPVTPILLQTLGIQIEEVGGRFLIDATGADPEIVEWQAAATPNSLYQILIERKSPGLILFTSGSSGRPKIVVHDFARLLKKFEDPRPGMITINFLMFDHWGGLNTLLHCLSSMSLVVLPESRNPHDVCQLIEKFRIELLPTTPSFLNLLLISGALRDRDVSSLRVITYGAEPMPETTLQRIHEALPTVDLRQTYGMIELGVLRAKSLSTDSLWVKIGGENYDLRVVDGILQVKTDAAMLGYLNADSPFTEDGYFITGDMVEQQGDYVKILGRASDLINVAGQKVYPSEVEAVILQVPDVIDVVVYGEKSLLVGKIVVADVVTAPSTNTKVLRQAIKRHCAEKLQSYCVPVKINFGAERLDGHRLKRRRSALSATPADA